MKRPRAAREFTAANGGLTQASFREGWCGPERASTHDRIRRVAWRTQRLSANYTHAIRREDRIDSSRVAAAVFPLKADRGPTRVLLFQHNGRDARYRRKQCHCIGADEIGARHRSVAFYSDHSTHEERRVAGLASVRAPMHGCRDDGDVHARVTQPV